MGMLINREVPGRVKPWPSTTRSSYPNHLAHVFYTVRAVVVGAAKGPQDIGMALTQSVGMAAQDRFQLALSGASSPQTVTSG